MAEIPAEPRLASLAARLRAQEIVLQCLCSTKQANQSLKYE